VDTRFFPNSASQAVAKLIELANLGNRHARAFLEELADRWQREHHDAVRDLHSHSSVCPENGAHFQHQAGRIVRRDMLIPWVEVALRGKYREAERIAAKCQLV
jgi:hypothetical protein